MPQPYDYNVYAKDGFDESMRGYAEGLQLSAYRDQARQQQAALERQQAAHEAFGTVYHDPSPSNISAWLTQFPAEGERYKAAIESLGAERKQAAIEQALPVYTALASGNKDVGVKLLQESIDAHRNSGMEAEAKHLEMIRDTADVSTNAAAAMLGPSVAIAMGPKAFAEYAKSVQEQMGIGETKFRSFDVGDSFIYGVADSKGNFKEHGRFQKGAAPGQGSEQKVVVKENSKGDVVAFDRATGKPIWTAKGAGKGGADAFTTDQSDFLGAMALQGLSLPAGFRSRQQIQATIQGLLDRTPDMTNDERVSAIRSGQIEFGAEKKETTTAAGQAGRVSVAVEDIAQMAPVVLDASANVPRDSFIPINKLMQMAETSISDPNLLQLRISINSLLNAYDMLAARGGTDMEKRREARGLLTSAQSPEALEAGIQMFQREAEVARVAAERAMAPRSERGNADTELSAEDKQALAWARSHPTDPRAAQILQLHGRQ